jgi:hypothetical protein
MGGGPVPVLKSAPYTSPIIFRSSFTNTEPESPWSTNIVPFSQLGPVFSMTMIVSCCA